MNKNNYICSMIRLIADSGSTKADWRLVAGTELIGSFKTKGVNPFHQDKDEIFHLLQEAILKETDGVDVNEIFFYSAGIVGQEKENVIKQVFKSLFPEAEIEAYSDVFGAARALFGNMAGIVCILGTGSNACFYNGKEIEDAIPPLGYILGDEGSGSVLGKKLVADYFKKVMPEEVRKLFGQQFGLEQAEVLQRVYRSEYPNRYLAGFVPFLSQNISIPYCQELVYNSMLGFFERNVLQLRTGEIREIGFVGSVAFHFSDIVEELAQKFGFTIHRLLKEPISGLVSFHSK